MQLSLQASKQQTTQNDTNLSSPRNAFTHHQQRKCGVIYKMKPSKKKIEVMWNESSTSMTRDKSPSHKIPKAQRFQSNKKDSELSNQFFTLNLTPLRNTATSIMFPKSKRPEHFLKKNNEGTPSSASYHQQRFMDDCNYKTMKSHSLTHSKIMPVNPQCQQNQEDRKFHYLNHATQSFIENPKKGKTIPKFTNYDKLYLSHGRNLPYQPQTTIDNPGVGKYDLSSYKRKSKDIYTMRKTLKRFNQFASSGPGPGSHDHLPKHASLSFNQKGTLQLSKRTYLTKFQEGPGPLEYKILRFLQSSQ